MSVARSFLVGDIGLRFHHAHDAEQEKPESLGDQLDLDGSVSKVLKNTRYSRTLTIAVAESGS